MEPDDEMMFGRALDESRTCFKRIECLRRDLAAVAIGADGHHAPSDSALTLAAFELHGATLRSLAQWYPNEARVQLAVVEWELSSLQLTYPIA